MTTSPFVSDPWSGLNHKAAMEAAEDSQEFPRWVPKSELRRLVAYRVIDAYVSNNARTVLRDPNNADAWQEYGDAALIIRRIADAIVGEDPEVSIVGADAPLAEGPRLPDPPTKPVEIEGQDPQVFQKRQEIYERQLQVWLDQVDQALATWEDDLARQPMLELRQRWLRDWAETEGFIRKLVEAEVRNVVRHGDGIFVVDWDHERGRPTVETVDPAAYFPDLDSVQPGEFPTKVHLAWPLWITEGGGRETEYVRRITYELVPQSFFPDDYDGPELEQPAYIDDPEDWHQVCLMTDGTWPVSAFKNTKINGFASEGVFRQVEIDGEFHELNGYPLPIDFIPLVHVTHDLAGQTHYGTSPISAIAQLLDELQASDTDESLASRWAAQPPMLFKGQSQVGTANVIDVSAGKAYLGGEGIDLVDMAKNLTAIMDRTRRLLKRVSVNSSVSEGLIGRVDASEVPSGFALTLSFTAFENMTEAGRLARAAAHPLLLKMVQRFQVHYGGGFPIPGQEGDQAEMSTEVFPAEIAYGAFMPQDLSGTIEIVARAVAAHIMSVETGIRMLEEAGVPVEDAREELAAILRTWGELAAEIQAATGSEELAAKSLGFAPDRAEEHDEGQDQDPPVQPAGTDLTGVGAGVDQ